MYQSKPVFIFEQHAMERQLRGRDFTSGISALSSCLLVLLLSTQYVTARPSPASAVGLAHQRLWEGTPAEAQRATKRHLLQPAGAGTAAGDQQTLQLIVVFKDEAGDAAAAANALVQQVIAVMPKEEQQPDQHQNIGVAQPAAMPQGQGHNGASTNPAAGIQVLQTIGGSRRRRQQQLGLQPSAAAASTAASDGSSGGTAALGLQAVVLAALPGALQHIRESQLVAAVFRDRVIRAQPRGIVSSSSSSSNSSSDSSEGSECSSAIQLAAGVAASQSPNLNWEGCAGSSTQLLWFGSTCSKPGTAAGDTVQSILEQNLQTDQRGVSSSGRSSSAGYIVYKTVKAVDRATGQPVLNVSGLPCVMHANTQRAAWNRQWFGSCGTAPKYAKGLPAKLCRTGSDSDRNSTADYSTALVSSNRQEAETGAAALDTPEQLQQQANDQQQQQQQQPPPQQQDGSRDGQDPAVVETAASGVVDHLSGLAASDPAGSKRSSRRPRRFPFNGQSIFGTPPASPGRAGQQSQTPKGGDSRTLNTLAVLEGNKPSKTRPIGSKGTAPPATPNPSTPSPAPRNPDSAGDNSNNQQKNQQGPTTGPQTKAKKPRKGTEPPVRAPTGDAASPVPRTGNVLPRQPVDAGESVPAGVARIEAATTEGVDYTDGYLAPAQAVTVGVMDSGVDSSHPDIYYVGGQTWLTDASDLEGDSVAANVDAYGHGTHVAGIVGARNNGVGVVGVVPGVPIYSLKVLDGRGAGTLSNALDAVAWAIGPEGQANNIKVINLSLAAYVPEDDPDRDMTVQYVCSVFQEASDAGVFVTVSAGNSAESLRNYLPAACPTVAVVTPMDPAYNTPSSFANYLPAGAGDAEKAHVIAAPGNGILSTISYIKDSSGYRELSGSSQAAPHVAGIGAACIMSSACPAGTSGIQKLGIIQAAARERLGLDGRPYSFSGDATRSGGQRYYGHLAWAKF